MWALPRSVISSLAGVSHSAVRHGSDGVEKVQVAESLFFSLLSLLAARAMLAHAQCMLKPSMLVLDRGHFDLGLAPLAR